MRMFLRTTLLLPFCILLVGTAFGQTPTTTIQNGNADTRLELNYDGGFYIPGTFGPTAPADSIPATGAGTRLMWYPAKAAFRAGRVGLFKDGTQWDASKVGRYSVAFGVDTKASGDYSAAMGTETTASGQYATAAGIRATASGNGATAMGIRTTSGFSATAMGYETTASGGQSTALGYGTTASAQAATAVGNNSEASGEAATAMGFESTASGSSSTAAGSGTVANSAQSVAMGFQTKATDDAAVALGYQTEATGLASATMGFGTTANGTSSVAMGSGSEATTANSLSAGAYNSANTSADGTLLVVGNGSPGARSDALSLDSNGNLEISGTLTESSDRRLKTSIRPLEGETMAKLLRLRPVRYQFKNQQTHPAGEQIGLVAQDVRTEFPALVSGENSDALSLSYSKFTAVLLKGLQEQQAELEDKEDEIADLKAENEEFEERLAALERQNASALPAGLTGPWVLTLLLGLGALGAGLLWGRRA